MGHEVFESMRGARARLAAVLAVALLAVPEPCVADEEDIEAFARVVVTETTLRAGPGLGYRVLHRAERGETFVVKGREGSGYWLRVLLPDGRLAYVLGDTIEPLALDSSQSDAPSQPGVFAPPALEEARGGFAMLGGVFDNSGYGEFRPAVVLAPAIALEPFAGLALSKVGRQFVYGAGATLNIGPDWPIAPYVHLGGGGITTRFNEDDPRTGSTRFLARAGGGLLVSFRLRILVRLEAMQNIFFEPDFKTTAQSYVGGLGTYF